MSLRDTINGAMKEAEDNALAANVDQKDKAARGKAAKADSDLEPSAGGSERTGFSRKSVSRAKPVREAAAGVRVVQGGGSGGGSGKSSRSVASTTARDTSNMTKEEKKEYRRERRDEQDRRNTASQVILKQQPGYKHSQRVWWGLLGAGFACTVVSWMMPNVFPDQMKDGTTPLGIFVFVLLVAAYALIIGAFVYDWRVVRPMRKTAEAATNGMTNAKVKRILKGEAKEIAEEESERVKAKEAKRSKRNTRHEQHK